MPPVDKDFTGEESEEEHGQKIERFAAGHEPADYSDPKQKGKSPRFAHSPDKRGDGMSEDAAGFSAHTRQRKVVRGPCRPNCKGVERDENECAEQELAAMRRGLEVAVA